MVQTADRLIGHEWSSTWRCLGGTLRRMQPEMPPLSHADAARWSAAAAPRRARWLLIALWVAALAAAIAFDPVVCEGSDCALTAGDAAWMALTLSTPVLLAWIPAAGCAAGIIFGAGAVLWDPTPAGRLGFGAHAFACAVALVWWRAAAAEQRRIVASATGGASASLPASVPISRARVARWRPLLEAGGALVFAIALFVAYNGIAASDGARRARAVEARGTLVAVDEQRNEAVVELPLADGGSRRVTPSLYQGPAPRTTERVTVLLDPADPAWVELASHPRRVGFINGFATAALLLATLLTGRWLNRRRFLQHLRHAGGPAVAVRVRHSEPGALVLAADHPAEQSRAAHAWARMPVGWVELRRSDEDSGSPREQVIAEIAATWRGEREPSDDDARHSMPAVLLGDLCDGGWAALVTERLVLLPSAPLRVGRLGVGAFPDWIRRLFDAAVASRNRDDQATQPTAAGVAGIPVPAAAAADMPPLPLTLRPAPRQRRLSAWTLIAGFALPLLGLLVGRVEVAVPAALLGSICAIVGAMLPSSGIRLHHDRLEVVTGLSSTSVPWGLVLGVRCEGTHLLLAWGAPIDFRAFGPFAPPQGDMSPEQWTERVGAVMARLREQADAPPERARTRLGGAGFWVLALYAVVAGAVLFASATR